MKFTIATSPRAPLKGTFAALKYPNYRLWFAGQVVSLMGTWMQTTAQGYLIYELTQSPAYLGYVGFAAGLPAWIFTLYGGVVADRMSRRTLLVVTQTSMMMLAFILAGLVFTNIVQPWHILGLALGLGAANAFDAPARQSFVADMVDRSDMTNAIALNSTMFNTGTFVGPAVAGVVYALAGPAWCFTINGISFLAVIGALLLMKVKPVPRQMDRPSAISQVKEGFEYVVSDSATRTLIANLGMLSLFGISLLTLVPAWAVDVLNGDVRTNGMLLSSRGLGALVGALMIAALGQRNIRGKLWSIGTLVMPVMMIAFSLARWLPFSLAAMVGLGWSFMIQANTSNAMIQTNLPDRLRGRVMSIFTLTFFGGAPLGSLLAGTLADRLGPTQAIELMAAMLLAFALLIAIRMPQLRRLA